MTSLSPGVRVSHPRFGHGTVEFGKAETAIVRFDHGLEECPASLLTVERDLHSSIATGHWDQPLETITRIQAEAIVSINDAWGVFSRSRIALLPHQLWVCHKVTRTWPFSWLVADDVGLGKTIEAGIILWPLLSKGLVKRLLILCPASLVEQWQYRLREMFDIRMARYLPEADTPKADFWNTHNQVVASLQTMRDDRKGRHERLLGADPWDLVIVDEAHHLNSDEDRGATLGYRFVEKLFSQNLATSKLFFTGTPHRGKNYGFFGLLQLLRDDLFSAESPIEEQLPYLRHVLIRNNKQNVTDMEGRKLFKPVTVRPETYSYSPEEAHFYSLLTEFIATGKAYASSLSSERDQQAVMLVLISMQKLASSSVAAIKKALHGRLLRIRDKRINLLKQKDRLLQLRDLVAGLQDDAQTELLDELQVREEALAVEAFDLQLMEDEVPQLDILIEAADAVKDETKIKQLISILDTRYHDRHVLFFTEYKATQALVMSALLQRYGDDCVTFINGDNRIEAVNDGKNQTCSMVMQRATAAEMFNEGKVRFLVSTEAAGEGIDLQESCYTLIHVDLPWNPMRLHQRVGRLNRYGQRHPVEVVTLRNPDTVESRIWDKLNSKIQEIMVALGTAMDEPEDLLQLVLGMTSSSLFTEIFSTAASIPKDALSTWFNAKTKTLGGRETLEAVKSLVGGSSKFDYSNLAEIPRKDLQDLQPFFEAMLQINKRRIVRDDEGITFKTPDEWLKDPGVRIRYENLHFSRNVKGRDASLRIVGVGHRAFDRAIEQARSQPVMLALVPGLRGPLAVFRVFDRVTGKTGAQKQIVYAVQLIEATNQMALLRDWQVIDIANKIIGGRFSQEKDGVMQHMGISIDFLQQAENFLNKYLSANEYHPFEYPAVEAVATLFPDILSGSIKS
ncbi:MAG: hypothetical protein A2505_03055 [Deltaproteobacteria bacterium RIFOXYD12_FULL_55_16]|nr:MAG: hypothetical protein A2505_03055 [Deltaproteobacteria bacterium RIFOXYD12_FULL_55_16]